jgi:predicted dehydrogenase
MGEIGFALIGAGRHGGRYARHIAGDLGGGRLVGLWRRDAETGRRQAAELGCSFSESAPALIRSDRVDAVVLAVPPVLHPSLIALAAEAGKALLVEKPLAVNLEAVEEIERTLRRHPVSLMVAHTLRFSPVVMALRARVGELGRLHGLHLSQRFEPSSLDWLDRPELSGGGIIIHTGVHSFDLIRHLSGSEIKLVRCWAWRVETQRTEDNFLAQLELADGAVASVSQSRSTAGRNGLLEISGRKGQLMGDHVHGDAYLMRGTARQALATPGNPYTVSATLQAFTQALLQQQPMPVSLEDGRAAVAAAEACYRSASTGEAVEPAAQGRLSG